MIDMFNYKYHSDMTHWTYNEEAQGFVVKAKENILAGQEVFITVVNLG
jgi:hypothetical protein